MPPRATRLPHAKVREQRALGGNKNAGDVEQGLSAPAAGGGSEFERSGLLFRSSADLRFG